MEESKKFKVKDLVNAGLFSVLMIIFYWIGGFIGYFPILMPLTPFCCSLLSGIVFMLYSTRINKFGMFLITSIIMGLVMSSHGIHCIIMFPILGLIAEYILNKGQYKSIKHARWAYTVFGLSGGAVMIPLYTSRESYAQNLLQAGYGQEYVDTMFSVLPNWSIVPVFILGMVGAYIGCTIGIRLLRKHFERAGMA